MRVAIRPSCNWNGRTTSHPFPSQSNDTVFLKTMYLAGLTKSLSLRSPSRIIGSHQDGEPPSHGVFYLEALRAGNESWNETMVNKVDLAYVARLDFLDVVFNAQRHSKIELLGK